MALAQGNAEQAAAILDQVADNFGDLQGADDEETTKIRFASGVYRLKGADTQGAIEEFEAVKESNPGFQLPNGVGVNQALSNTYYRAGREQLEYGGETAGDVALEMFNMAGENGDPNATDIRHGRTVALYAKGDQEGAKKEAEMIKESDPEYYNKIKTEVMEKMEK